MKNRVASSVLGIGMSAIAWTLVACVTPSAAADKPATPDDDACVFSSTLDDYQPVDSDRLILWAPGHRQPYLITLLFPSTDLKFGTQLGFDDRDGNGMICGSGPDAVIIPRGIPDRIKIKSMVKITPDEAKQLTERPRKGPPKQVTRESAK